MITTFATAADELDQRVRRLGLLDPTDRDRPASRAAPRLSGLAGMRLGLLDNRKPNAALLLHDVGELLIERHGAAGTVLRSKFIYSRPADPLLLEELAGCDAVLTAIGD